MHVKYFLDSPMINFLFFTILFCIEKKRLPMRNLTVVLPLKLILSGTFRCSNAIDGSIKIMEDS